MANQSAALVVDLTAKLTGLQQGMDRAVRVVEDGSKKMEKALSFSSLAKTGAGFFAVQLGFESLRDGLNKLKDVADEWTRIKVLVENVTRGTEQAARAQDLLYQSAQATRQNFGELARSYASFARNADDLGISSEQAVAVQTTVAQAIALSGARADSAASALVQFGQGIASGVLRGEELNSVLEQTPKLAKALADGLGVSIGQLIKMGKEGELTSEKIIAALEKVAPQIQKEFDKVTPTIGDAFVAVNNAIGNMFSALNRIVPIADTISSLLIGAANAMDRVANALKLGSGGQKAQVVGEVNGLRSLEQRLVPFTDEKFLVEDFKRRNKGMVVDMDAIRGQLRLNQKQLEEVRAAIRGYEDEFARQGLGAQGEELQTFAQAEAAAEAKLAKARDARAEKLGALNNELRGISKAFEKNAAILRESYEAGDFGTVGSKAALAAYEKSVTELMKKSGFFPDAKRTQKEKDPFDELIRDAEQRNSKLEKLRESALKAADPLRELKQRLADIATLERLGPDRGGINAVEAAQARAEVEKEIYDTQQKRIREQLLETEPLTEVREDLGKYLTQLRIEADLIGLTEVEREARIKLLDAEGKGLESTSAEWQTYKAAIESALAQKKLAELDKQKGGTYDQRTELIALAAADLQARLDEVAALGYSPDVAEAALQQWKDRVDVILDKNKELKDDAFKLGDAFQSAFEKAIVGGEGLSKVFSGLIKDIASMFLRQQITAPLAKLLNTSVSTAAGGSTLFDLFRNAVGFANGGNPPVGVPSWVGERGPELFVPKTAGTIVPNHALGGGGVSVYQSITVNGGASMSDMQQAMRAAKEAAKAEIMSSMQRRGAFSGA